MQANNLKPKNKRKKRKTIGRGGKKGTYSGKGNKGQKARSGAHIDPLFEGGRSTLIDHMKKKKGFKSRNIKFTIISLKKIGKKFKEGDVVSIESLIKAGLVGRIEASLGVKILGKADSIGKLSIDKDILLSSSAKESIEKAGGKIIDDQGAKIKEQ